MLLMLDRYATNARILFVHYKFKLVHSRQKNISAIIGKNHSCIRGKQTISVINGKKHSCISGKKLSVQLSVKIIRAFVANKH